MKKKNVVRKVINIAAVPPPIGGIASFLKRLKSYTDELDNSSNYVYVDTSGKDIRKKRKQGFVCIRKPFILIYLLTIPSSVIVFHSNSIVHLMLNCLLSWKHEFVYFTHGESVLKSKNRVGWRNRILRKARYIVTPTEELYKKVKDIFPDKNEIAYIPFILYSSKVEKMQDGEFIELREKVPFLFSAYANSLHDYKGVELYGTDMLIEFLRIVREQGFNVGIYLIVSNVDDEERLKKHIQRIEELNLQDYFVISTKTIEEGSSLFASSDVYVRPTNTDGDSFSVWEALHVGIPVLTSDATQRPNGCFLFKTRDLDDMVSVGISILSNYPNSKTQVEELKIEGNERKLIEFFNSVMEIQS